MHTPFAVSPHMYRMNHTRAQIGYKVLTVHQGTIVITVLVIVEYKSPQEIIFFFVTLVDAFVTFIRDNYDVYFLTIGCSTVSIYRT